MTSKAFFLISDLLVKTSEDAIRGHRFVLDARGGSWNCKQGVLDMSGGFGGVGGCAWLLVWSSLGVMAADRVCIVLLFGPRRVP